MEDSSNEPVQNDIDALTSSVSFSESPKKCNLSFSINFDFNDVNSENSTDSENADLQIDISEVDNYEPSSKHKRETVEEASVLNEMEEEIERHLDAEAAKTNLTATNVKNILKHVIPYEHLMTMVQKWLQDTENDVNIGPKLTRAKAKKLAATKVILWPITTAQKTSSEVQALIQEELPDDSSDEEYNPEHDKQSDDDREVENTANSDIESQLSMSINKDIAFSEQQMSHVQYDSEGIFKIPAVPYVATEEESIGQRTRSKLSLSETSLEEIEQAFIPPDITADMTDDWDCELDEDWDNFLKGFTQPLAQALAIEDDPEADPEYSILEDEETDLLDKEELRTDRAVEVPRKEQYDLIAELLESTLMFSTQEQEVSRKKKILDNTTPPIESDALSMNSSVVHLLPVLAESELPKLVNSEQRLLLAIQFQQHVQLMAQHFVMTYMHPEYHSLAKVCKQNLNSLRYLSNGSNSAFNAKNLEAALELVSTWENKFNDTKFYANFKKNVISETAKTKTYRVNKSRYTEQFLPELEKLFVESKALMYPQLLPLIPFRNGVKYTKSTYLKSEETLIALGIEQFLPFVTSKPRKFHTKKMQLIDTAQLISHYLLPCRDAQGILHHINKKRASKDENSIKHYFKKGCAPRIIHYITLESKLKAPKDQPMELLPLRWQMYLQKEHKNYSTKSRYIFDSYNNLSLEKEGNMYGIMKSRPNIPNNHLLRNPVVNMLPKILPATLNPKTSSKINNLTKRSFKFDNSNDKKAFDNVQNTETYKKKTAVCKVYTNSCSLEANTSDIKLMQTDKSPDKNNAKLNTVLTRSSKIFKESPQLPQISELPQIRKTTPRLAKTKSAQNMKLMAQALGSKNSSCSTLKSKEKDITDKNIEHCSVSKVDNEEEIAELMLASSTIIKDPVNRKKTKQTRELEIIKRLLKAENPLTEEEREAKFAASYLQKLHLILESNNPETFKAVIKLYLDYSEKLENINHTVINPSIIDESKGFSANKQILQESAIKKDILTIQLYQEICKKLQNYPEICTDFLLFLKPHQAAMIGKSTEYMMLQKMNDFVHVAQIYFAKQPSRIAKMMQAITQLSSDPHTTLENVYTIMSSVFKGHPLVMDLFLQILPTVKPPESLLAPHMFENMTCPLGPYDKNTIYTENASELYENIELPAGQEDPYGGENCKCDCHNTDEASLKNNSEHCVSCGIRFLNGRIYLQTPEGLRPAKITFPGEDREKLENIARISLKIADKANLSISSKKQRKSSKNDSSNEDICQKQSATKYSPLKDNEDNEKAITKSKRNVKFTLKADERKNLKRIGIVDHTITDKRMRISQCKNKREKKIEESNTLLEQNKLDIINYEKTSEFTETENNCTQLAMQDNSLNIEAIAKTQISSNISNNVGCNSNNKNTETALITIAVEDNMPSKSDLINNKPWTRQEDMILLQKIKKEYSEKSFILISEKLENRSVDQVKERCQTLLSLLQKMM